MRYPSVVVRRVVVASMVICAGAAHADVRPWSNPAGGEFNTPGNWTGGVPGAADTAYFNLGSAAAYTVRGPLTGSQQQAARLAVGNDRVIMREFFGALQLTDAVDGVVVGDVAGDNGFLNVQGASGLNSVTGVIGNAAGSVGAVQFSNPLGPNGQGWTLSGELTVGDEGTGSLTLLDRSTVTTQSLSIGRVAGSNGTVRSAGAAFASIVVTGNAYVGGSAAGPGGTGLLVGGVPSDGTVSVNGNLIVYPGGTVQVSGRPTQTNGRVSVGGNATIQGRLLTTPGGLLNVTGTAALSGLLELELTSAFFQNADPGDQYTVVTAGSVSGVFSNAPVTYTQGAALFSVAYNPGSVVLTVVSVPAPGAALAMLLGIGGVASRRRRAR
jgi:T5SS/PEP-CTERM-associated repeat protein